MVEAGAEGAAPAEGWPAAMTDAAFARNTWAPIWTTRAICRSGREPSEARWKAVAAPTALITYPESARTATSRACAQAVGSRGRTIAPLHTKLNWHPRRMGALIDHAADGFWEPNLV